MNALGKCSTQGELPIGSVKPTAKVQRVSLTRTEAAESLGISTETLDRLVKRGLIKPSRALSKPLFPLTELERFLQATQSI